MKQLSYLSILVICCLQTDKSLANNQCPSEFRLMRNSSTWSDLSQNVQNMDLVDSEAFQELTTQLAELQGIFNHFKDIYVRNVFQSEFEPQSLRYSQWTLSWIVPPKITRYLQNPQTTWSNWKSSPRGSAKRKMLISAYNLMQRVSIGLELVYKSLEMSDSAYVNNNGNFWKLTCEQSLRVIESIFLNLKIVDFPAENLPILKREITPQNAVCINSESTRNLRDFVIMQDSLKIVEFYLNMAKIEQQFQQRQLVQRAAFNPLTGKTTFSITY